MQKVTFDTLGLKKSLIGGIFAHGFEEPSAIQQQAIPAILTGRDTICQAQSGTGKTATFSIAALQQLDEQDRSTQILVISPTRELADQSFKVAQSIAQRMNVNIGIFTGGSEVSKDVQALSQSTQVAIGTTGRIIQLIEMNKLKTHKIKMIIIDEADEMLKRDFAEQLVKIFKYTPKDAQVVLVSATMPTEVLEITNQLMNNPVKILVKEDKLTLDGIRQYFVPVQEDWKISTMMDIFKVATISQAVIFCNSINRVKQLHETLLGQNCACECIHAEMDQSERDRVMSEFRAGKHRFLIATNLIARGIDVQNISMVINYDIPKSSETYLHRIGRSGRFGRKGYAINFVTDRDSEIIKDIKEKFNTTIEPLPSNLASLI
uniref:Eukaryotic translation initiation factor 4A n=1 Tax=Trepomonas sp. PC1 TaxID=1076344 RepID=A0A146K7F9_9EUKA|eukprot:JAP91755.1 Eukaryotic translation initiation factor 4A [Trepomonas sp. PC1]